MKKERITSRQRLSIVRGILARCALGVALPGLLFMQASSSGQGAAISAGVGTAAAAVPAVTCSLATVCITDDATGDHLSYTCPAGTYTYKRCSTGLTLTGTGVVNTVSGIETLTDSKPDRRINAGFLVGPGTGKAVIYFIPAPGIIQTLTINQTTPFRVCGTC